MKKALRVSGLNVTLSGRRILENISFDVEEGKILGIVGPNGGGKTTLLKAILGLVSYEGEISIFGFSPAEARKRGIVGYLPQRSLFDPDFPLKAKDVVALGMVKGWFGKLPSDWKERVEHYLKLVNMEEWKDYPFGKLSGGQQQRVSIARVLAGEPQIVFLDEPNTGVDVVAQEDFYQLLTKLNRELNLTIVMVSHDIGVISSYIHEVACLNRVLHYHGAPVCLTQPEILKKVYGPAADRVLVHDEKCENCGYPDISGGK